MNQKENFQEPGGDTIQLVAVEFSRQLKLMLEPQIFDEMLRQHIEEDAVNKDICVSHEYCDPNEAMILAFEKCLGYSIDVNPADTALYNQAWNLAKQNNFYFNEI
jgi:hypothetical protein